MLCQVCFESFCKFTPCEQDAAATAPALESNIRAQPRHSPLIGAAGMLLPKAEMIVETQVW